MSTTGKHFLAYYQAALQAKGHSADSAQLSAARCLQDFFAQKQNFWFPSRFQGIYLFGGVGRGKTFLMDCFFAYLPSKHKKRAHFHEVSHDLYRQSWSSPIQQSSSVLLQNEKWEWLCLDEFHIQDIGHAALYYSLFQRLLAYGTRIVLTSNTAPTELYPEQASHPRLRALTQMLQEKFQGFHLQINIDYRMQGITKIKNWRSESYLIPAGEATNQRLQALFTQYAHSAGVAGEIMIHNRRLPACRLAKDVAWFLFVEICNHYHAQDDYLLVVTRFKTIFLSDIPRVIPEAAARRLIWLVDLLFDHKIRLFVSAAATPFELEVSIDTEFQRTRSKLIEMHSPSFLCP